MSFIGDVKQGTTYAPGFFLANGDEEVIRETRQIAQSGAIETNDGKYVPMGSAYPSNDSNAIGLLYEDVDVTAGDMPGSVVTGNAVVYEDRLAVTGQNYGAATVTSADNPTTEGWYEKDGDTYSASSDTVASKAKTYYTRSGSSPDYTYTAVEDVEYGDNPAALGLYERSGSSPNYVYTKSTDTQADGAKTYYEVTSVARLSDNAKTALIALGFKFIAAAPAVTRPDWTNS